MSRGREKLKLVLPLGCLSGHSLPTKVTCACCTIPLVHAALVSSSFKSHLRPIFLFLRRRGRLTPLPPELRLVEKLASLRSCESLLRSSLISPTAHCLFFFNLTPGVSRDLYGVKNMLKRKFLVPFFVLFRCLNSAFSISPSNANFVPRYSSTTRIRKQNCSIENANFSKNTRLSTKIRCRVKTKDLLFRQSYWKKSFPYRCVLSKFLQTQKEKERNLN